MPFYDFKCKENHVTEENISYTDMQKGIKCSECGQHAERIYSINSLRPSYGYDSTRFNQREKKRLSKDKFNGHI
jgi:putative FmdB family regulatory protein|tara:strand:- start:1613 stop:1834 length:222 start_codon:yes stop_codon:yes gene_type:complete